MGGGKARRPHAPRQQHLLRGDHATVGFHATDTPVAGKDACGCGVFQHLRAARPCAFGHGLGDIQRVHLPIRGHEETAKHIVNPKMGIALQHLFGAQEMAFDLHPARVVLLAAQLFHPKIGQGHMQSAVLLVARGLTGFDLQLIEKPRGVTRQFGLARAFAQLAHNACRMPSRARGNGLAFQQDRRRHPFLGKVIQRRDTNDAAADHDNFGG